MTCIAIDHRQSTKYPAGGWSLWDGDRKLDVPLSPFAAYRKAGTFEGPTSASRKKAFSQEYDMKIEIRAAEGGADAKLFVRDLADAYTRYLDARH